jgi:hypothetical protein
MWSRNSSTGKFYISIFNYKEDSEMRVKKVLHIGNQKRACFGSSYSQNFGN